MPNYFKIYNSVISSNAEVYKTALDGIKVFYIRKLLLDLLAADSVACKEGDYFMFLLNMMIEADYLYYGFNSNILYKQVVKTMENIIVANPNAVKVFLNNFNEKAIKSIKTHKPPLNLFECKFEAFKDHIYGRFIYKYMIRLMKLKPKEFITQKGIQEIMKTLLLLTIIPQEPIDRHKFLAILKEILNTAMKIKDELSVHDFNNIISNEFIKVATQYCADHEYPRNILWKSLDEISLLTNNLYNFSVNRVSFSSSSFCSLLLL